MFSCTYNVHCNFFNSSLQPPVVPWKVVYTYAMHKRWRIWGSWDTCIIFLYGESMVRCCSLFPFCDFFCNAEHFCLHGGLSLYGELHLMSQFVHFCCFTKPNCHVSLSIWRLQDPLHRFSGANWVLKWNKNPQRTLGGFHERTSTKNCDFMKMCYYVFLWWTIYLWRKFDCCILSCWDLPNWGALVTLLVPLESPQWVGLHCVGFILFELTGEKLLNIEQFFHRKKNHLNQS
jgi:hypothetical protein